MPKRAITNHNCGLQVTIFYSKQVDVFLNPSDCPRCLKKFFPQSVFFDDGDDDDGSIKDFEEKLKGNSNGSDLKSG